MNDKFKRKASLLNEADPLGIYFALPFAVGFVLFFLSPLILYVILGFSKLSLTNQGMQLNPVGLENFRQVLFVRVGYFEQVLKSLGELLLTSPAIVLYSLFVATLLNQEFKGRGAVRAIFFLPVIMASGIAAVSNNDSLMGHAIHALSGDVSLTGDGDNTSMVKGLMDLLGASFSPQMFSFVSDLVGKIYTITMSSGVQILIFLAGLQGISPSLYEASSIEGATSWENFWKITLPMISPVVLVNSVYTIVDQLGGASNAVIMDMYDTALKQNQFGFSSAMGLIYFSLIFIVVGFVIFIMSKFVYYEDR
ncbi:MAG: carbohydrate ABC transporter permease [Oscillospiraceae bacterium]